MQTLYNYARQLVELNLEPLQVWDKTTAYASFSFGLVEELLEYHEAKFDYETGLCELPVVIKEAGDVLAYVVLCLAAVSEFEFFGDIAADVEIKFVENTGYLKRDVLESACELAGSFKRFFREQKPVPVVQVVTAMQTVLDDLSPHSITLADIAEANLTKLKDRAIRGQLLQGQGSNR